MIDRRRVLYGFSSTHDTPLAREPHVSPPAVLVHDEYDEEIGMTPFQALRMLILLASIGCVLGLLWLSCEKVEAAQPDTVRVTLPTQDMTAGTCAAPTPGPTTETLFYWRLFRAALDTVGSGSGAPGASFDWATPVAWPITGTRVYLVIRDPEGNASCLDSVTVKGRETVPPFRATVTVR